MPLFIASEHKYGIDHIFLQRDKPSCGHLDRISNNEPWAKMEEVLEKTRRPDEQSRITAYFACDTPAQCGAFIVPQILGPFAVSKAKNPEIFYYHVESAITTPAVMALINRGMHHLDNPDEVADICAEYWRQPKHKWKYLEHLIPEARIIGIVEPPDEYAIIGARVLYDFDFEQAKRLWPDKTK